MGKSEYQQIRKLRQDECARAEADKVKEMISEYKETGNPEILSAIKQKIRNNSVANHNFVSNNPEFSEYVETMERRDKKIESEEIREKSETGTKKERKIDKSEYAKIYSKVSEQEKQVTARKILQISKMIENVMNKEVNTEDGER